MLKESVRWLVLALSVWSISSTSPAQNVQIDFGIGGINFTDSNGDAIQPPQDFTPCLSATTFMCNYGSTGVTVRINQDPLSPVEPVVESGIAAETCTGQYTLAQAGLSAGNCYYIWVETSQGWQYCGSIKPQNC